LYIPKVLDLLKKNQPRSVCVETSHIYMNEDPGETHDLAAQIGARIAIEAEKHGSIVARHLFIDNFNPSPESFKLDVDEYISRLCEKSFSPQVVTFEAALELPAQNILHALNGKTHRYEGDVFLTEKKIKLISCGRPTCNLLDASLYVAKLSMFELAITILPFAFKDQQQKVMRILNVLGYTRLPIINVFYDKDKQVSVVSR
jgi:hypothetical protein